MNRPKHAALGLRAGDVIEVRSEAEILATLDEQGALDGLPFMPEMLQFCGKRFRVEKRADKTCNTITVMESRRLYHTVHLENLRCSGADHGGCQAQCYLFWKEAWLKRVPESHDAAPGRAGQRGNSLPVSNDGPVEGLRAASLVGCSAVLARHTLRQCRRLSCFQGVPIPSVSKVAQAGDRLSRAALGLQPLPSLARRHSVSLSRGRAGQNTEREERPAARRACSSQTIRGNSEDFEQEEPESRSLFRRGNGALLWEGSPRARSRRTHR